MVISHSSPVPVVRLKSTLHLKSTLLLKITLILKYSRISLIHCQMQLIWVLVSTNDVLNNWIIMVLKKCKRIPIKKESIIGLEGRLKILWVEKYSKSIGITVLKYWINSKTRGVWILEWHLHVVFSSCDGAEHALLRASVRRRCDPSFVVARVRFVQKDRRHSLL